MVGSQHQAVIPEGLCKYDDALPYENEDKLLWNPISLTTEETENYLLKAREPLTAYCQNVNSSKPTNYHIRDDEQVIFFFFLFVLPLIFAVCEGKSKKYIICCSLFNDSRVM